MRATLAKGRAGGCGEMVAMGVLAGPLAASAACHVTLGSTPTNWWGPQTLSAVATTFAVIVALAGPGIAWRFAAGRTEKGAVAAMRRGFVYMYDVRVTLSKENPIRATGFIWKLMNLNNVRRREIEYYLTRPQAPESLPSQMLTVVQSLFEVRSAIERHQNYQKKDPAQKTDVESVEVRSMAEETILAALDRSSEVESALRRKVSREKDILSQEFANRVDHPVPIPEGAIVGTRDGF